jgi:hypothetical protein
VPRLAGRVEAAARRTKRLLLEATVTAAASQIVDLMAFIGFHPSVVVRALKSWHPFIP